MVEDERELELQECDQSVNEGRYRLIFDLISGRNAAEFDRSNNLDSKASSIIGFVGIIIGLLATLISFIFNLLPSNSSLSAYYSNFRFFLFAGIFFLAVSILLSLIAYSVKPYQIVPETNHLIEEYAKKGRSICDILRITSRGMSDAIKQNKETDDDKAKWVRYSLIFFGVGMGLVILFVFGLLII